MTADVIDTALALPWAVAAVAVTHPLHTTTTTTAAAPLVATVLVATTTADAHRLESFMTGVMEGTDDLRRVVAWEGRMSMVHRVRVTLTILTMPGPDHLPVATTTLT